MTDLHTHILPKMDDGARDSATSIQMLQTEHEHGVDTVVLSSHFYRDRENAQSFFARRAACKARLDEVIAALPEEQRAALPKLVLGAEVAWVPNLAELEELPQLCIEGTQNMLLELPFTTWNENLIGQLYDLMGRTGITLIIAHLERYMTRERKHYIEDILSLGMPIQISADMMAGFWSHRQALTMLEKGRAQIVASDCHNMSSRPPNLGQAMQVIEKKLGKAFAQKLKDTSDALVVPSATA